MEFFPSHFFLRMQIRCYNPRLEVSSFRQSKLVCLFSHPNSFLSMVALSYGGLALIVVENKSAKRLSFLRHMLYSYLVTKRWTSILGVSGLSFGLKLN